MVAQGRYILMLDADAATSIEDFTHIFNSVSSNLFFITKKKKKISIYIYLYLFIYMTINKMIFYIL